MLALLAIAGAGVGLILLVNNAASGGTRVVGTIAVAVAMWIGLMAVLRMARRGG
jgi:hypothetical protein